MFKRSQPDFIIVGAAKCGTTSLFQTLGTHPKIFIPENKEPWFYSHANQDLSKIEIGPQKKRIIHKFDAYVRLFDGIKENQICGEASTVYLYDYENTIDNIYKFVKNWGDMKIIIMLRNPVNRAFSHYMNDVRAGYERRQFSEVIQSCVNKETTRYRNYLEYGLYSKQVKTYLETFKNVKIIIFEQMIKNKTQTVYETFDFLGCKIDKEEFYELKKENVSGRPKYPLIATILYSHNPIKASLKKILPKGLRKKMSKSVSERVLVRESIDEKDREYLKKYYSHDILMLEKTLGYQIEEWK